MTVPRKHLSRYVVVGYKQDGTKVSEVFNNGRDAYIMESFYKRQGYRNVTIYIK